MQNGNSHLLNANELLWVSLCVGIAIAIAVPAFIYDSFYSSLWLQYKTFEVSLTEPVLSWVPMLDHLPTLRGALANAQPRDLSGTLILAIERSTLWYTWLYMTPLFFLVYKIARFKPENIGPLNSEEVIEAVTREIAPFNRHLIKHNPQKDPRLDATVGPYANRIGSFQYCMKHSILKLADDVVYEDEKRYIFDRDRAHQVMLQQMGSPFRGVDQLSPVRRWLLASLFLFLNLKKDDYFQYLGRLSYFYAAESKRKKEAIHKEITAVADKIIAENTTEKPVDSIFKRQLGNEALGNDIYMVMRQLVNEMDDAGFNPHSFKNILTTHHSDVWHRIINDQKSGVNYDNIEHMPRECQELVYLLYLCANGNQKQALKEAKQLTKLSNMSSGEIDELPTEIAYLSDQMSWYCINRIKRTPYDKYKSAVASHYYELGFLLSMYCHAEQVGVVTTARFTWLLFADRPLFWTLNDQGIPEHSIEVCYPRTHFYSELKAKRKLKRVEARHQIDTIIERLQGKVKLLDSAAEDEVA